VDMCLYMEREANICWMGNWMKRFKWKLGWKKWWMKNLCTLLTWKCNVNLYIWRLISAGWKTVMKRFSWKMGWKFMDEKPSNLPHMEV
jgi:hypothetical protein